MPQFPSWTVGKRVDATTLNQMIPNIVTKVSATTITSNTTLANDSELTSVSLGVGTWEIEVMLWVSGATAGNLKTAWAFTTGTLTGTPNRACIGPGSGNTAVPGAVTPATFSVVAYNTALVYGINSTALPFYVLTETCTNFIVATAGTWSIQVAQNASSATSTVIQPGSRVKVRQIA